MTKTELTALGYRELPSCLIWNGDGLLTWHSGSMVLVGNRGDDYYALEVEHNSNVCAELWPVYVAQQENRNEPIIDNRKQTPVTPTI